VAVRLYADDVRWVPRLRVCNVPSDRFVGCASIPWRTVQPNKPVVFVRLRNPRVYPRRGKSSLVNSVYMHIVAHVALTCYPAI
jgi:hypothetical protein